MILNMPLEHALKKSDSIGNIWTFENTTLVLFFSDIYFLACPHLILFFQCIYIAEPIF